MLIRILAIGALLGSLAYGLTGPVDAPLHRTVHASTADSAAVINPCAELDTSPDQVIDLRQVDTRVPASPGQIGYWTYASIVIVLHPVGLFWAPGELA